jgi:surface antigen
MNFKVVAMALGAAFSLALVGSSTYATDDTSSAEPTKKVTVVTVKKGDSLSKIAKRYNTTYVKLYNANKSIINPDVIHAGDKIRIPKEDEKLPDRFGSYRSSITAARPVAASASTATAATTSTATSRQATATYTSSSAGNTYVWGQCTWYVKNRRPDLPNRLGNGGQWAANAAARGYATGSTPRAGAVAEIPGHVMYVESVNGNGTINISEMNYNGGVGIVNYRTIAASSAYYIY